MILKCGYLRKIHIVRLVAARSTEDFQARRAMIRYRDGSGDIRMFICTQWIRTGSRTNTRYDFENYQQADGSIKIPEALIPYMGGITGMIVNY